MMTWPIFFHQITIDKIASKIAEGGVFKRSSLLAMRPQLDEVEQSRWPVPTALHNATLIELRLIELEIDSGAAMASSLQAARAQTAIETALRSMPSDGFMWFALFWVIRIHDGVSDDTLRYLRMSYSTAPHEGWIALRRNPIAVSLLPVLPQDLARLAVAEFADLVSSGYIEQTADIITGPGWGSHDRLLTALIDVPQAARQQFAKAIYNRGVDIIVPGVESYSKRPWR